MDLLRRATPADAEALTRLRGFMHASMGDAVSDVWHHTCVVTFARRLAGADFVAFVVEVDGEVVSGGAGWLQEHLPSPHSLNPERGHIASMCTDPGHLRQGYARRVFEALMGWFADQGVQQVTLRATSQGQPLYEAFGFRVLGGVTMAWVAGGSR